MEPTANKPQDIVDTTDSLEAVGACRSMKNFLFWVIFIGLLIPQGIFWLDRLNLVDTTPCTTCKAACVKCSKGTSKPCEKPPVVDESQKPSASVTISGPLSLSAVVEASEELPAAQADQDVASDEVAPVQIPDNVSTREPADSPSESTIPEESREPMRIPASFLRVVVAVCNFLVLMAAMLYCLSLLMCLKISLTGRLGGINHVTRAFFVSLLLVMLLIPWQKVIPGVLVGTVWMPSELLCGRWAKADGSTFLKVLFYLRFVGLWFVAMWLLFWAQIRSAKWAQATLRRLGIVR